MSQTWQPRRTPKATARKTVPTVLSKCTSSMTSPFSLDSPDTPPPPTTTATTAAFTPSSEMGQNATVLTKLISTDDKTSAQKQNSSPTQSSHPVSSDSEPQEKTLIMVSGTEINVENRGEGKTLTNSGSLGPRLSNYNAEDGTMIRSENSSVGVDEIGVKAEAGAETLVQGEKAVVKGGGSRIVVEGGKRKVIKKTVKIVKKVVKKRVPKRFAKSSLENEETERVENVKEQIENPEPKMDVSGSMEIEKVVNVSESLGIEKVDPSGTVSVNSDNCEPNDTISMQVENEGSKPINLDSVVVEKVNSFVKEVAEGNNMDSSSVLTIGISSKVPFADKADEAEGEGSQNQIEDQNWGSVEKDSGELVDDQNVVPVEAEASEGEELVKELAEESGIGSNNSLALSGEMEALERKRRRRTEIFLGGLHNDVKEEDIRKVFEQVGEVTDVRLVMNSKTGKNKGFAFLRFASAADAKEALAKYSKVEICGKQCGAQPVEGNDTIYLGNLHKKWKNDDIVKLMKQAGIEKIDKITVMTDPNNVEQNRGFAFLELETCKDAQIALNKLQKNDVLMKQKKIKVAWAQPLVEPKEEELRKVKAVYAEYLPSSWDEEKVRDFFKRFGEIESVTLARNLPSSKRKDFGFVNYTSRESALACIEAFSHDQMDDNGSKVKVKVSLAKPMTKAIRVKPVSVSVSTGKEHLSDKPKAAQSMIKVHEPRNKGKPACSGHEDPRVDRRGSTNDKLIQLLRQQASGPSEVNYHHSSLGSKRLFSALGDYSLSSDPRGYPRTRLEGSYLTGNPSYSAFSHHGPVVPSLYSQRQNTGHAFESPHGFQQYSHFETRERAPYFGHSGIFRRY